MPFQAINRCLCGTLWGAREVAGRVSGSRFRGLGLRRVLVLSCFGLCVSYGCRCVDRRSCSGPLSASFDGKLQ